MTTETRKLRELVLYIAEKSMRDPRFGATKLNKILFYSDALAYKRLGRTITGADYKHFRYGPVPTVLHGLKKDLDERGEAAEAVAEYGGQVQRRLVARREPDLSVFSAEEVAIVDSVIESLWDKTGREVSELSHLEAGYQITQENETIPMAAVMISDRPPTLEEAEKAKRYAEG